MSLDNQLISLDQARHHVGTIAPLGREMVPLASGRGRIAGADITAVANCPSVDVSLKDGFAVIANDIATATREHPVPLTVIGSVTAGDPAVSEPLQPGTTLRIMTGGIIPAGADAVLSAEFARDRGTVVHAHADAHPGRNILTRGGDVTAGQVLVHRGQHLTPTRIGLLAAGGISSLPTFILPRVAVVATGSELVRPGDPIGPGQVAASNLITLVTALEALGLQVDHYMVRDNLDQLERQLAPLCRQYDVLLTCGGVLDGDKDFTLAAMTKMGATPIFQRVRMGPGKGIAMSRCGRALVFNLPGGPPSNHVAFQMLALPAIRALGGAQNPLVSLSARLEHPLQGQQHWTQLVYGCLEAHGSTLAVRATQSPSRLMNMAAANCLVELAEGVACLEAGDTVMVWPFDTWNQQ